APPRSDRITPPLGSTSTLPSLARATLRQTVSALSPMTSSSSARNAVVTNRSSLATAAATSGGAVCCAAHAVAAVVKTHAAAMARSVVESVTGRTKEELISGNANVRSDAAAPYAERGRIYDADVTPGRRASSPCCHVATPEN